MKKYLLSLFALVLAIGFSAFTTPKKSTGFKYYWYRQSDHTLIGNSDDAGGNPLGCSASGSNCVKGWFMDVEPDPEEEPTTPPDEHFSFNQ